MTHRYDRSWYFERTFKISVIYRWRALKKRYRVWKTRSWKQTDGNSKKWKTKQIEINKNEDCPSWLISRWDGQENNQWTWRQINRNPQTYWKAKRETETQEGHNIWLLGIIPKDRRTPNWKNRRRGKQSCEAIMTKNFPKLMTHPRSQIQEVQRTPRRKVLKKRKNIYKSTLRYIIFKLQKQKENL